jgi:protein-L-isoaspartate(D-aspartate) O-methyltransferase
METWLDALNDGGRLILPLSTSKGFDYDGPPLPQLKRGAVFRIEKRHDGFAAKCVSGVSIIPCESARDVISEAALAAALARCQSARNRDPRSARKKGSVAISMILLMLL